MKTILILTFLFSFQAWGVSAEKTSNLDNKIKNLVNSLESHLQAITNKQSCHTSYINTMNQCRLDFEEAIRPCEFIWCTAPVKRARRNCVSKAYTTWTFCTKEPKHKKLKLL